VRAALSGDEHRYASVHATTRRQSCGSCQGSTRAAMPPPRRCICLAYTPAQSLRCRSRSRAARARASQRKSREQTSDGTARKRTSAASDRALLAARQLHRLPLFCPPEMHRTLTTWNEARRRPQARSSREHARASTSPKDRLLMYACTCAASRQGSLSRATESTTERRCCTHV
jgi:hypothetical protein